MTTLREEHPLMRPGLGRLQGKVAAITGADSGIGRATSRLFAREGAKVVCLDLQETGNPRVDKLIEQDGGQAVFIKGDVTQRADLDRMVAAALSEFGGLDILYNNAGSGLHARIHEFTDEQWNWNINLNLNGVYHGVRAALPHFMEQGHGNIVSTASSLGLLAGSEYPAYCASKAAVINLTRQLALDYGPQIRVNCVCPGPIATPRHRGYPPRPRFQEGFSDEDLANMGGSVKGLHRGGRSEEVAYAVLFLASDESSYITGHALAVDGGQTIDV